MLLAGPPTGEVRIGSVGKLCPGYEMSPRDDRGAEVMVGTQVRLWRSSANCVGYWDSPDVTAKTIVDGWLDTRDVMRVVEDGYLWFCGRKKQVIIHDESNICPQEVEEAVKAHAPSILVVVPTAYVGYFQRLAKCPIRHPTPTYPPALSLREEVYEFCYPS